jgi:hypothetical protein
MLQPWPILFNPKQTNCLENSDSHISVKHDPWLGEQTKQICLQASNNKLWIPLISQSTHINWLVNLNRSWDLVPDRVESHLKDGTIIVNMSCDPFRGWENRIVEDLKLHADQFVVLSGDLTYLDNPREHICFFPYLYLWQRYSYSPVAQIDSHRQYKVSCLNRQARYHRIENFIKLRQKSYFGDLLFNMLYHYNKKDARRQCKLEFYNQDIITEFEKLIPSTIPVLQDDPHRIDIPAYTDSYVNLVTETSVHDNTVFISEKTWKPFMSGQLALWLGNPGTVAHLRKLGFDVFDDIFDGHKYDQELNLNRRIDMIHDLLDNIMTINIEKIWSDTLSRRQHNIDHFYSANLEKLLTSQCDHYQL